MRYHTPALRSTQLHVQWIPILNPGVKRSGRGVDHSPPPSVGVKERVEAQLHIPRITYVTISLLGLRVYMAQNALPALRY